MMKYILNLLILFVLPFGGVAQEIGEMEKTMSKGLHNSFFIDLPGADKDMAQDIWKDYLKEYSKKVKDKDKEYYTEEAKVPLINGNSELIIYGKVWEGKDQSTLFTWVDLGGEFLHSIDHPKQTEGLMQFLEDYFNRVRRKVIEEEIKDEEDRLKDINKALDKLIDKNEDFHKDIRKAQEKIREAEDNIAKNLKDQDDVRIEMERQKRVIEKLMDKYNNVGKNI